MSEAPKAPPSARHAPDAGLSLGEVVRFADSTILRWLAVPLLGTALVTGLKLTVPLSPEAPFVLFGLIVLASAWLGGLPAGLCATLFGSLSTWYFFLVPRRSFGIGDETTLIALTTFATEGVVISLLVHAFRRAYDAEAELRQQLEGLAELTDALSTALSRQQVADLVVERGTRTMGADICTLSVLDEQQATLILIAERGVAPAIVERIRRWPVGPGNPVFPSPQGGSPLWVETRHQYRRLFPSLADADVEGRRAQAFWSMPLLAEGRPLGMLSMGFYNPRRFQPHQRRFVSTFSLHCAQALSRAERFEAHRAALARAEQAQRWLETTLRSIGDAVITTDAQANVLLMNPIAEKLTGWSEAEAKGQHLRSVFRIVNEETRRAVESPAERVLAEGVVVGLANHTVLLGRNPGQETPIDDSGAPIRGDDGEVLGVVLVFRDVSEHKRQQARRAFMADAMERLSSSLDYRATVAKLAQLAVPQLADWCAIDLVRKGSTRLERLAVAHVDPAKVDLARELHSRYPSDPEAPHGPEQVVRSGRSELMEVIPEELLLQGAHDLEHLEILKQLQLRSALVVPIVGRSEVFGALSLVYAESQRVYTEEDLRFAEDFARRAATSIENALLFAREQQLREAADVANRAKDEFLATVSHELRTPLHAILGWARMLNAGELAPEKRLRALQSVERNAAAMAQLIEDLLDVSRIVSGRMRLELAPLELAKVIDAALETIRPAAEAKGVQLSQKGDAASTSVLGDPVRLQQVVWNLVSNAVKFTPAGGRVEVLLDGGGPQVTLVVSDTGRGIEPSFLAHVFAPFRQADGSSTREHGGLGLGLAIAKHLVELHGGQVQAESRGEGLGSRFTVRLPHAATPRLVTPARGSTTDRGLDPPPPSGAANLHVLVVDDDEDGRALVQAVLEGCGCRVTTAASVADALARLEQEIPDLLVSDIAMPGRDGYDLIRQLRSGPDPRLRNLPAVALTAHARAEDRRELLKAGYLLHIPKPLDPAELTAVVVSFARIGRS